MNPNRSRHLEIWPSTLPLGPGATRSSAHSGPPGSGPKSPVPGPGTKREALVLAPDVRAGVRVLGEEGNFCFETSVPFFSRFPFARSFPSSVFFSRLLFLFSSSLFFSSLLYSAPFSFFLPFSLFFSLFLHPGCLLPGLSGFYGLLATQQSDFSTRQPGHAAVRSPRAAWLLGSLVLLQDGPATWADWTSGATWLLGSMIFLLDSLGHPGLSGVLGLVGYPAA